MTERLLIHRDHTFWYGGEMYQAVRSGCHLGQAEDQGGRLMADHEDNVYPSALTPGVNLSMEGGPEGVELMIYSDFEETFATITLDRGQVINLIYDLEQVLER